MFDSTCMDFKEAFRFCHAMNIDDVGPKEDNQLMSGLQQLLMSTVSTATKCLVGTLKYDRAYKVILDTASFNNTQSRYLPQ
ncbi:hypothetical protein RIF29_25153 [Crotalaria pallida]|uniref:Uncharacterized protein n=1 Tax=Crotalaria pallida TaxID=3830 RepID=A0AAN9EL23_CROPI